MDAKRKVNNEEGYKMTLQLKDYKHRTDKTIGSHFDR